MRTLVIEPPAELQDWLERRRRLGQDLFDEVWEGVYHVAPAPRPAHGLLDDQLARTLGPAADAAGLYGSGPLSIGVHGNFRVPDRAYLRERPIPAFVPTAAIVVEIVSPGDETWDKPPFYFAHGVEELLIVDPQRREVHWFRRGADRFEPAAGSALLGITAADLADRLDWPPR